MNRQEFINNFWNYYLILERNFVDSLRYVELSSNNYDAYSIDFVSQLQGIGSEVDVLMKVVSGFPSTERKTITDYATSILGSNPGIINQEVRLISSSAIIKPFDGWTSTRAAQSLFWWEKYNSVKHSRVSNFRDANLKSVLYSLAALYILERWWLKHLADITNDVDIPNKDSEIFSLLNWVSRNMSGSDIIYESFDGKPVIDGGEF
jgi:hypothetical protein